MEEKRRTPRKIANEVLKVFDTNTGDYLGRIVNITTEGFMLIGENPIENNSVFQVDMVLAEARFGKDRISFGTESLWCSQANLPNHYWTGFQIIDISIPSSEFIESLIEDWSSDKMRH